VRGSLVGNLYLLPPGRLSDCLRSLICDECLDDCQRTDACGVCSAATDRLPPCLLTSASGARAAAHRDGRQRQRCRTSDRSGISEIQLSAVDGESIGGLGDLCRAGYMAQSGAEDANFRISLRDCGGMVAAWSSRCKYLVKETAAPRVKWHSCVWSPGAMQVSVPACLKRLQCCRYVGWSSATMAAKNAAWFPSGQTVLPCCRGCR